MEQGRLRTERHDGRKRIRRLGIGQASRRGAPSNAAGSRGEHEARKELRAGHPALGGKATKPTGSKTAGHGHERTPENAKRTNQGRNLGKQRQAATGTETSAKPK